MKSTPPSLAPLFRSDTQGRILARLFSDPDRAYSLTELAASTRASLPTVHREVARAEQAGIVTTARSGVARMVRANDSHPQYEHVRQLVLGTYGAGAVVAAELRDLEGADAVLLFGSWAARFAGEPGRPPQDIDVLVIGAPDRDEVDDAAERAERVIGLPVHVTVRSSAQWLDAEETFLREVRSRPVLVLLDMTDTGVTGDLERPSV